MHNVPTIVEKSIVKPLVLQIAIKNTFEGIQGLFLYGMYLNIQHLLSNVLSHSK